MFIKLIRPWFSKSDLPPVLHISPVKYSYQSLDIYWFDQIGRKSSTKILW